MGKPLGTVGLAVVVLLNNSHASASSASDSSEQKASSTGKCPVAFLWNWTGSNTPPSLPAGHPAIFRESNDEKPAVFNTSHFPNGVNANFLGVDSQTCAAKFAGPNGLFECESRQIKKYAPNIIQTLRSYGLKEGGIVGDVGAGTGVVFDSLL